MADTTSAMLVANGNVTVNGSPIERATTVFPGDKVQTGPNTVATLTSQGSAVTVAGNSSLVFSKSFVNVLCGTALVSTRRGMSARVSNLLVQPPRGTQARFQITQNEGQLQIIAREGTLAIDNGVTTTSLQPGRMLTAHATCMAAPYAEDDAGNSPTPQDQTQDQDNNKKKKGGAYASGNGAPPTPGGTSTSSVLLLAGGAILTSTLVICFTVQWCNSSSPVASSVTPAPEATPLSSR